MRPGLTRRRRGRMSSWAFGAFVGVSAWMVIGCSGAKDDPVGQGDGLLDDVQGASSGGPVGFTGPDGRGGGDMPGGVDASDGMDGADNGAQLPDAGGESQDNAIIINEIAAKGQPEDWVELYNLSEAPVDISGWMLTDAGGGLFSIPTETLVPPKGFITFLRMTDFDFGLGSADTITLMAEDVIVDSVSWLDGDSPEGGSFGRLPDGTGAFKTLALPTKDAPNMDAPPVESCGDSVCGGGEDCSSCALDCGECLAPGLAIVINEVVAKASDAGPDWIELANSSATSQTLDGWSVEDASGAVYVFPVGTEVPALGYLVLLGDASFAFGLGKSDTVSLKDDLGNIIDTAAWIDGDAPEGSAWARIPDKAGSFQTTTQPSPGTPNIMSTPVECGDGSCDDSEDCMSCADDCGACLEPTSVVLNEIVAKAIDAGDDWVELHNIGDGPADISGWTLQDDSGAVHALPMPTTIFAGGYLLITQTELGFGLGKADSVTLKDAAGQVVDTIGWLEGDAPEGSSFARIPNGVGPFVTTGELTPDAANILVDLPSGCGDGVCGPEEGCDSCDVDCGACPSCPTELFISEYIEGSSSNKAIELYNGTGVDIDLSNYVIWNIANGGEWTEYTTPLSGILASGQVFVLCNSALDPAFLDLCDDVYASNPVNFNGDDAVGLARDNSGTLLLIDQIGTAGPDVGDGWEVSGVPLGTKDATLVRKPERVGSTDWSTSSASDWLVYEQDTFEYLGAHQFAAGACN